jgi:hypothetical protein
MPTMDSPLRFPADSGKGLGQVVIAVLEILRDLLERQAIRKVESGSLTSDEIERLGQALIALDRRFTELRELLNEERIPTS